jgi:hypothetical protein
VRKIRRSDFGKEDNFEEYDPLIFRDSRDRRGNPCGHSDEKLC